jgi:hypothetical protein
VLKAITPKAEQLRSPNQDSLMIQGAQYRRNRSNYQQLAQAADKISLQPQSETAQRIADSLHSGQITGQQALTSYYIFTDEFARGSFFARSNTTIKSDLEYVRAIVEKITRTPELETQKLQEKQQEQQNTIDSKIEKLKKQMEGLEKNKK